MVAFSENAPQSVMVVFTEFARNCSELLQRMIALSELLQQIVSLSEYAPADGGAQ
jgi:hypothetical protein